MSNEITDSENRIDASASDLEQILTELPDVESFHVATDGDGVVIEVHLVTNSDRTPKNIVRDIESMLLARLGVKIDRRKISIAHLPGRKEEAGAPPAIRPQITSIAAETTGHDCIVQVRLTDAGTDYDGASKVAASKSWTRRAVANATINAVERMCGKSIAFAVEDVTIVTLSREHVALVGLSMLNGSPEQAYCGSAIVRHDEKDAIARATLDAINRRLANLKTT